MEKTWIRYFGFCFSCLIFGGSLFSQERLSVPVEVIVDIKSGNLAEAKAESEKKSFESAVEQSLPASMDPEKKAEFLKRAASYVKTYKKIGEKQIGTQLTSKYLVEIELPKEAKEEAVPQLVNPINTRFEISVDSKGGSLLSSDILKFVQDNWKLKVSNLRMSRSNIRFEVLLNIAVPVAEAQLSQFVGGRGAVRSFEVKPLETDGSGVIPREAPMPLPGLDLSSQLPPDSVAPNAVAPNTVAPNAVTPNSLPMVPIAPQ